MIHFYIMLMHEVVPSVVAMAVSMVASRCMIFCMSSFLFMGGKSYELRVMSYVVRKPSPFTRGI